MCGIDEVVIPTPHDMVALDIEFEDGHLQEYFVINPQIRGLSICELTLLYVAE